MLLPDRTQTIIAKNSEQLNKPSATKKTLINLGKLWAKTNTQPISLSIKAPNAAATIRGQNGLWTCPNGQSSLAVVEKPAEINDGELATVEETGQISVSRILSMVCCHRHTFQTRQVFNSADENDCASLCQYYTPAFSKASKSTLKCIHSFPKC